MNNEIRNTKYEIRTTRDEKGFTLIEIVVAIGLLAMVVFFAGTIFRASIGSYRTAMAQAEIMAKLRVISQQLDSDFKGLRKDAPMFIWFQVDPNNNRFDQIMFFADGDFQSVQLYSPDITDPLRRQKPSATGSPIVSNVARIQYGQAMVYSPSQAGYVLPENQQGVINSDRFLNIDHRTLARCQHLLTADPNIFRWPINFNPLIFSSGNNNYYEHDTNSLSQWQAAMTQSTDVDSVINACLIPTLTPLPAGRPSLDFIGGAGLHMLMAEGVGNWSIQWSYLYTDIATGQTHIYWWPSIDPDGNGNFADSDFSATSMGLDTFGFYFNTAAPSVTGWFSPNGALPDGAKGVYYPAVKPDYPQALKFTFTLYDSRGVFRNGQTFTHIVYLGD